MADYTVKQHDTKPTFRYVLTDVNGPIDLTDVDVVKLILKGATVTVTGICDVVNAVAASVKYEWANGDTDVVGTYKGEIELTYDDGGIETIPNDGYFELEVVADLA